MNIQVSTDFVIIRVTDCPNKWICVVCWSYITNLDMIVIDTPVIHQSVALNKRMGGERHRFQQLCVVENLYPRYITSCFDEIVDKRTVIEIVVYVDTVANSVCAFEPNEEPACIASGVASVITNPNVSVILCRCI